MARLQLRPHVVLLALYSACTSHASGGSAVIDGGPDARVLSARDGGAIDGLSAHADGGRAVAADADSGRAQAVQADAGDSGAAAAPPVPRIDCGFRGWNTRFSWKPTSVSMAVLETPPNVPEERYIGSPEVLDGDDTWDMFYAMGDGANGGRVGHATSRDRGLTWQRVEPTLTATGRYAGGFLDTPGALREDGRIGVYYFANTAANVAAKPDFPTPGGVIAYAELGPAGWTSPLGQPALAVGAADAWDGLWVESPVVKQIGGRYFMWYTANDNTWTVHHGVATSNDGLHWQRSSHSPAVSPSTDPTRFDSAFGGGPAVAQAPDGTFLMLYACAARANAVLPPLVANLCLATSPAGDGERFTAYPSAAAPEPIIPSDYFRSLSESGLSVLNGPLNPSLVFDRDEGVFKLYYENQSSYIGLLTLPVCTGM